MSVKSLETRVARIEAREMPVSLARVGRIIAERGETVAEARDRFLKAHPREQLAFVKIISPR
jgi:hypothetical protein